MTTDDALLLAIHRVAWLEAEYVARAAFAHVRLEALANLEHGLTESDLHDAVFAIWDDYIDGRRADERSDMPATDELREQASIFSLCSSFLDAAEMLSLAAAAWGSRPFEVHTRRPDGALIGKLGWYRGDTLQIRKVDPPNEYGVCITAWTDKAWPEGQACIDVRRTAPGAPVLLHPAFAR